MDESFFMQIDYYFFPLSPYVYLGSKRFHALAERFDAQINYCPVKVNLMYENSGGTPFAKRHPNRLAYRLVELRRWSEKLSIPINFKPSYFPVDDSLAAGVIFVLKDQGSEKIASVLNAVHEAIWVHDFNINDRAVLERILLGYDLDAASILDTAEGMGERYETETTAAMDKGIFGTPSYVIEDEIFWGQDRLDFLKTALERKAAQKVAEQLNNI